MGQVSILLNLDDLLLRIVRQRPDERCLLYTSDAMEYYRNVMSKRIGGFDPAKSGSQFPSLMFSEPSWYVVR